MGGSRSRGGPGFRRTIAAGTLALGAVGAVLALPAAPTASAQTEPPPGADAPVIDTGTANAKATVVSVAPTAGSLAFALTSGTALAQTSGGLAESQAQSFDLGLIGSSLTAEGCDGSEGAVAPGQLPQPTSANNREGDAAADSTEAPLAGSTLGGGHEEASATRQPSSRAAVTSADLALPPLLGVDGGLAVAEAEVLPDGAGREARSTVTMDLDLAGVVRITGLRWTARHRTGVETVAEGGFTVDALSVLGLPIPAADLQAGQDAINAALLPTGFRIELPRVERIETPIDLIRVTPLRIMIIDSELGAAGVRPALEVTREVRSQLFDAVTAVYCSSAALLLVGEIGIGVASGTGALIMDIGGVEVRSAEVVYEDPFGAVGGPPSVDVPDGGVVPAPGPAGRPAAPPAAPPVAGPAPAPGGSPVAAPSTATIGTPVCESVHEFRSPGCSRGAAGAVGIVGAAATAGVALLDLRRRRLASAAAAAVAT